MITQDTKDYFDLILNIKQYPFKDASLDFNHLMLLFGTILSQKPTEICEMGIGTGISSLTILAALKYNEKPYNYTCVDNLYDLGGNLPQGMLDMLKDQKVNIVISNEREYLEKCPKDSYDLILSDADHMTGGNNVELFLDALRDNGILFAHDVLNPGYPTLKRYMTVAQERNLPYFVFNQSSLPTEGCKTGFIMILNKK
jgi:predicted O-methyltransferase YrrM